MATGETPEHIIKTSGEVIEGVRTLNIVHQLAIQEKLQLPIVSMLYRAVFEEFPIDRAIRILMTYNYAPDVDFL